MSRLFTFGCSFTNYRWSTWADCLAPEFDEFQNWGQSGAGNHYIFNSVMECDQLNKFTDDDTVVVCWTGTHRDDWYVNNKWQTLGNIHNCPIYNSEYLKTHVDDRGYLIRDFAFVKGVKTLLENRLGLNWKFISMMEISSMPWADDTVSEHRDVMRLYEDVFRSMGPSYQNVLFKDGWPDRDGDPHPSPAEHLAFLDAVLPGWVTKEETRAKMQEESVNLRKNPAMTGLSKVTRL